MHAASVCAFGFTLVATPLCFRGVTATICQYACTLHPSMPLPKILGACTACLRPRREAARTDVIECILVSDRPARALHECTHSARIAFLAAAAARVPEAIGDLPGDLPLSAFTADSGARPAALAPSVLAVAARQRRV